MAAGMSEIGANPPLLRPAANVKDCPACIYSMQNTRPTSVLGGQVAALGQKIKPIA
jgi:hypothetical protein